MSKKLETNNVRIGFIGVGKLGQPCAEVLAEHYDVVGYDLSPREPTNFRMADSYEAAVKDRDIIFVAVPTPHDPEYGGETPITNLEVKNFNYGIVADVFKAINPYLTQHQLVVLISTVLPGTVRKHLKPILTNARFIYNPYLIAMGSVKWDMVNPEMIIIGTEDGSETGDAELLKDIYAPVMQNSPRYSIGTWDEAESIKIFYNTFISAKIGLVNMIQDVAERNGNINVDVVTEALANSTQRIMGPRYMKAGLGDSGACHPRDNIALRWLSKELDLGYDLFDAIMQARDAQAKNMAQKLIDCSDYGKLPIVIHGKAYKPLISHTEGSYSLLVGHYVQQAGPEYKVHYLDPLTGDDYVPDSPAVFLMAHSAKTTYTGTGVKIPTKYEFYCTIPEGSIIVDPWREIKAVPGSKVIHYGNTRLQQGN